MQYAVTSVGGVGVPRESGRTLLGHVMRFGLPTYGFPRGRSDLYSVSSTHS